MSNTHARIATPDLDSATPGLGSLGLGAHRVDTESTPLAKLSVGQLVFVEPPADFIDFISTMLGVSPEEAAKAVGTVNGEITNVNEDGSYEVLANNGEEERALNATWDGRAGMCSTHVEEHPILVATAIS